MKKVLAICLIMVMVASMSVNVFAARGGFVSSPSGNRAPILVHVTPKDEDCTGTIVITPYGDKEDLPEDMREALEDAYDSIANSDDLSKLNDELAKYASDKKIPDKNLAVSDLFNIHTTGCENHDKHDEFDVTLDADTLNHFVGLLYQDSNGKWQWVPDAKVVNNGEHLKFTGMGAGPYAIVVDTTEGTPSKTGDSDIILICAAVMAVSAAALVVVFVKGKKQRA